ncbi:DUF309 domain-containing protein [Thalassoroseus pseudoceratinae]|uniref:DUF309 domain-containing protein n=1 Tax=Thalassoroseus pseudoceratinae TaxID=2713176 RepID=UPI00141FFC60|nr:DUF309 domain-containing protein [Thalassoroseus pseudoceratinae]
MEHPQDGVHPDADPPSRYCPGRLLPAYAFVPGVHPHPVSSPNGHSFGVHRPTPTCDFADPLFREEFLFGIDLFNLGYYWEAHEAWECLWIACGRHGHRATLLKGLIKLAAAGVKSRVGNATGVSRHTKRAVQLLSETLTSGDDCGIDNINEAVQFAEELGRSPITDTTHTTAGRVVLSLRLVPSIAFR